MEAVERPGTLCNQVNKRLSESSRSVSEEASGSTCASLSLREAASAVARASRRSFLRALPAKLESTRTRAESLGPTSTTHSPDAANLTARCRPSPLAFSTAQRRSGNRLAQRSSHLKPERSCGKVARSRSSPNASSTAATATPTPCGDRPLLALSHARVAPFRWGPLSHRRERRTFRLRAAHIPLLSHSAHRAPAGRKPRTSQPTSHGRQEIRERSL